MRYNNRKYLEIYKATGNPPVAYFPLRAFIEKYANEDEPAVSIGCGLGFECVAMYQAGRSKVLGIDSNPKNIVDACDHPMVNYYICNTRDNALRFFNILYVSNPTLAVFRHMNKVLDDFSVKSIASMLHHIKVKKVILEVTPSKYGQHEKAALLFAAKNYLLYYKVVTIENNFMLLEIIP